MSTALSQRSLVIAWQGLPFYACRCLAQFRRAYPEIELNVITSRSPLAHTEAERECGGSVRFIDSEKSVSFKELGLPVPEHLFATSWSHAAYRNLAREARTHRAGVTVMIDNCWRGSLRQWAGALYFRLRFQSLFDDAWVPGKSGARFAQLFGFPPARVHKGLYAADETIFSTPPETAPREGLVFVGQFIERKAVRELWQAVQARKTLQTFSLIGDGPLKAELAAAGAPIVPHLAPTELALRLRAASALILPSRLDHWGLVLHEAALSGCLLLTTAKCGAGADLIRHAVNGYVMRDSTPAEIGRALNWLERLSPSEISRGRQVSSELAQQFSPAKWSAAVVEIITEQAARK